MAASDSFFPEISSVKELASSDLEETIPIVDFALLISNDPHQRSTAIQKLGKACQEWGVFLVINHGVPEELTKRMVNVALEFFQLPDGEKKQVPDGVSYGSGVNNYQSQVSIWRDFVKMNVHPEFASPAKPAGFSETTEEFSKTFNELLARELLKGINASLSLEENCINNALNMENSHQVLAVNFYPPCPQPDLAIGLTPHTDHNLLTILIQHGLDGLQVKPKDEWIDVNVIPNSFVVNIGDQFEILSNGKYKSILHRAMVNSNVTRMTIVLAISPALDAVVAPLPELVDDEKNSPAVYTAIKYTDYRDGIYNRKLCLDQLKIKTIK